MLQKNFTIIICVLFLFTAQYSFAQTIQTSVQEKDGITIFSLSNNDVVQQVFIKKGMLAGDALSGKEAWLAQYNNANHGVATDGNFALKMMWTDWSAPGKVANADVQVSFNKKDYRYQSYDFKDISNGGKELELYFLPFDNSNTIQLKLTYQLLPGKFYARRQVAVRDTIKETNWLDKIISRTGKINAWDEDANSITGMVTRNTQNISHDENDRIVKKGAFGQPCAIDFASGGVFFGVEYPAATTIVKRLGNQTFDVSCDEIVGTIVKDNWIKSKWVVEGLSPDHYVKNWFFKYLPDIRVAPDRPYALYNSWYDLRSPAFKDVAPEHIMNEKNIMNIISQFKKNMIEPYGIHLDAFVLDDGWDVQHSDWQLRKTTFPNGLKPVSNALDKLGTTLGVWFGPTGGYSFRMDRINWMRDHGYEVTGNGESSMLCIAGTKYSALFQKRATDMVRNEGVGYFKWDGIQFSCSDPTHGHPIGYYSRRAILDSMIAKCNAVRAVNPNVFLNITSGTWLSPWWMSYGNQIWMQGGDYGFADIPSVNQRDASMTYKDMVLYDDFYKQDDWFPISNLMTHGIIKGTLNEIGGADDPLSKFTDDAMFYFGRGVTMYELYISPDLLNKGEWTALSKSLKWAENRFPVLVNTDMVGGDPGQGEAYGYVHCKDNKSIIAVRNPVIQQQSIHVKLDSKYGINPAANSLVLERVYPTRWISPGLYAAGATVDIPLAGYESAVYEVYPLDSARRPLVAGVTFNLKEEKDRQYDIDVLQSGSHVTLLNPGFVSGIKVNGASAKTDDLVLPEKNDTSILQSKELSFNGAEMDAQLNLDKNNLQPRFVIFLHPDSAYAGRSVPGGKLFVDGSEVKATLENQKGMWSAYSFVLTGNKNGAHTFRFELDKNKDVDSWKGTADVWLIAQHKQQVQTISITTNEKIESAPMPPSPYQSDAIQKEIHLGSGGLNL